ncbi:hypothetical protein MUN84_17455 [Hymenobacter sp. 5516J-16]|uniref:nucleoside-diphosphate sugar epimerase/dehydratase n=1 Tax=Hymenobacter sp. 5516J-16 TaxID=2932253 RepID=UPI001FD082DE|nr:hypothetical protein [Hymenobacter sp. 5516J-16]UOQ76340.1 hypothetical protein MUN84_17455 [Hymenobacter sp. 5516J-16]
MYFLKTYWEQNHRYVRGPYPDNYMAVAVPVYVAVWLLSAFFSGAYDKPTRASRIVRGIFVGTVLISAFSNFLDAWRFSKALIVLGGVWAVAALVLRRVATNFIRHRRFSLTDEHQKNVAIIGSLEEAQRVRQLLEHAGVPARVIGYIEPGNTTNKAASPADDLLGEVRQLDDIIRIYNLNELIFCGRDLAASQIIGLMVELHRQPPVEYKILPQGSEYIIGSSGKDSSGDYYTLDITLNLFRPAQIRNKRLLDILVSLLLLLVSPVVVWAQQHKLGFLRNCLRVLAGSRTWVGLRYATAPRRLARAVLSAADAAPGTAALLTDATRRRLELLYAKEYEASTDVTLLLRCFRWLGREA